MRKWYKAVKPPKSLSFEDLGEMVTGTAKVAVAVLAVLWIFR